MEKNEKNVLGKPIPNNQRRLPDWLKAPLPSGRNFFRLKGLLKRYGLNTVCESASCPNVGTCWDMGTLTLMILGDACTRACKFCDVLTERPNSPKADEPEEVAEMLSLLDLKYAVITSVDRDDLLDGGAEHWAQTIIKIRQKSPALKIEVLIPDFQGNEEHIGKVCEARPDVLAHNLETVASLQESVRPQCRYDWSLKTLEIANTRYGLITKSGMMLGMGETEEEVIQAMKDLVNVGCKIFSLGQYLRPTMKHLEVVEYILPGKFEEYKSIGESLGFGHVEAGPLVRSSYMAEQQAAQLIK
jgi:lipoic acid synthetase